MKKEKIRIGNKTFTVQLAITKEDQTKGLMGIKELPKDEGMLFMYEEEAKRSFWMKNTLIPLDIIFIDSDGQVVKVAEGKPNDLTPIISEDTQYVLEVNANSGIKEGMEIDMEEEPEDNIKVNETKELPPMIILDRKAQPQYELEGGERIVSRKETIVLIKKAKRALKDKTDGKYKSLALYMYKVLSKQDSRDPQYVQLKN